MLNDWIGLLIGYFSQIGVKMRLVLIAAMLTVLSPCVVDAQDVLSEIAKGGNARPLDAYMKGKQQAEARQREEERLRLERQVVEMERQRQQEAQRLERERLRLQEEQMQFRMEQSRQSHAQKAGGDGELELLEKLALLGKLRDDKVISETEFQDLKAQVMAKYGPTSEDRSAKEQRVD